MSPPPPSFVAVFAFLLPAFLVGAQFFHPFAHGPFLHHPQLVHPHQLTRQSTGPADVQCSAGGYFRNPDDCTRFYRCVDISEGLGYYQAFHYACPSGLVFDQRLSVCNYAWAAPPCDGPEAEEEEDEDAGADGGTFVVVAPSFTFQCTSPGLFSHDSDCSRFWLCRQDDGTRLTAGLYRCPEGFLYDESVRRCLRAEDVACHKVPDLGRIAREPLPYQLRLADLQGFFARHRF